MKKVRGEYAEEERGTGGGERGRRWGEEVEDEGGRVRTARGDEEGGE